MKIKWVLFFLLMFWLLGYFREFFFVNLNSIMYEKYYGHTTLPVPSVMALFTHFSYETLYYSKYIFTVLWMVGFFLLNYFALVKLSDNRKLLKYLLYAFGLMLSIAALSMIYGYFVKERLQDDEYTLSRWLFGIAQSPIICLILLASEKLYYKTNRS